MHPKAIAAIVQSLMNFIAEIKLEDEPPTEVKFPNEEWSLIGFGLNILVYRRSGTHAALAKFREVFRDRRWRDKWSIAYVGKIESNLLNEGFASTTEQAIVEATERAVAILEAAGEERLVILPIGGVRVGNLALAFPGVVLRTIDSTRLADLRQQYYTIVDTTPHGEDQKVIIRRQIDERTQLLLNSVCASITTRGDKDFCLEDATRKAEVFVDFLQMMALIFEPSFKNVRIRIGGDLVTRQPPFVVISADGSQINDEQKLAFDHRFELEQQHLDKMNVWGFDVLIAALGKDENKRSKFEEVMLRSMHWIADGDRQQLPENKTTSYITAIEMFFTVNDAPVTRDVSEGVAFVLANTLEDRKRLASHVSELYGLRSKVSHRGERVTGEDSARDARNIAVNLLARLSAMPPEFDTLESFREWNVEQRLSPSVVHTKTDEKEGTD